MTYLDYLGYTVLTTLAILAAVICIVGALRIIVWFIDWFAE